MIVYAIAWLRRASRFKSIVWLSSCQGEALHDSVGSNSFMLVWGNFHAFQCPRASSSGRSSGGAFLSGLKRSCGVRWRFCGGCVIWMLGHALACPVPRHPRSSATTVIVNLFSGSRCRLFFFLLPHLPAFVLVGETSPRAAIAVDSPHRRLFVSLVRNSDDGVRVAIRQPDGRGDRCWGWTGEGVCIVLCFTGRQRRRQRLGQLLQRRGKRHQGMLRLRSSPRRADGGLFVGRRCGGG